MRFTTVVAVAVMTALNSAAQPAQRQLFVCHAGSLTDAFKDVATAFMSQHPDVAIEDVSGGSVSLARRIATGAQRCDVYASADYVDIDLMLKPARLADYTVVFAHGRMVLAYLATDPNARGITTENWYDKAAAPGVRIAGAHPFLDPGGYRAHLIFDLAERHYRRPGLLNALLEHYATPALGALGKDFSFQLTYEHSAASAAMKNPAYRYLRLPASIDLSDVARNMEYAQARLTIPGLGLLDAARSVTIPATRAAWGVTIPRTSGNVDDAIAFVNLLFGPVGHDALMAHGPAPLAPPIVGRADAPRVPRSIKGVAIE